MIRYKWDNYDRIYLFSGQTKFGGVDFSGTFYIHDDKDDDFAGFVFSFQDSSNFYALMWKKDKQTYWYETPFKSVGQAGIQLKVILVFLQSSLSNQILLMTKHA